MEHESKVWPVIGGCAAFGLWLVSAIANFQAGQALSSDEMTRLVLGCASISMDLMKVALLFALCAAWKTRRVVIFSLGAILFLACTSWSLRAGGVFIADALSTHAAQRAHADRITEQKNDLLRLKQRRAGFLSEQQIKPDAKQRSVREAALSENKRVAGEFSTLTREIEADIAQAQTEVPTHGESFSKLLQSAVPQLPAGDRGERAIWIITAVVFALILEFGSSLGPLVLARAYIPVRQAPQGPQQSLSEAVPSLEPPTITPEPAAPVVVAPVAPLQEPKPMVWPSWAVTPAEHATRPSSPVSNVVSLTGQPMPMGPSASIADALLVLFEPEAGGRILLADVVASVNGNVPRHRRLTSQHKVAQLLMPALRDTGWGIEKAKIGGRVYITGLRPRHAHPTRRKQ